MQPSSDLLALVSLALEAGREIMAVRDRGFTAQEKADGTPVTIADQRAEAVIEAGLAKLFPATPMLAEEAASDGRIPELGARFFCVDPIDGTRDFVEGETGEFTVNIALIEAGRPSMGVVLAPATGALYAGEARRAFKGRADARAGAIVAPLAPIFVRARAGAWRVVASRRSGKNSKTEKFCAALGETERASASSSIKFCLLAEGSCDLYPRFGQVSEWDAAAGHAVLLGAGGDIMNLSGVPLTYGHANARFLVEGFIAYADSDGREAALAAKAAAEL